MNMMRGTKMPYKLKQTCNFQLLDYLYMYDLLLPIDIEELKAKNVLKIKCNDKGYSIFNLFCAFTYKARNTALMFEIFAYKTSNTALIFEIFASKTRNTALMFEIFAYKTRNAALMFEIFDYKTRNTALMFEIFAYKTRNTALFDIFHTQSNTCLKASLALCIYQLSFYKRRI